MTASNEVAVSAWKRHPWYPAVRRAHEELSGVVPGYRIEQIKDKFHELRIYYTLPPEIDTEEYRNKADKIICFASGWCAGYDARRQEEEA